jgi:hypothetical protein
MIRINIIGLILIAALLILGTTVVLAQGDGPSGKSHEERYEFLEMGDSPAGDAPTDSYVKDGAPEGQTLLEEQPRAAFDWSDVSGLTQDADPNDPALAGRSDTMPASEKEGGTVFSTGGADTENVINGKP